jgi:hypothetical protein
MGKGIGYRGNCCRYSYFAEPLIVCKKEGVIMPEQEAPVKAWCSRSATSSFFSL